MHQSHHKTKLKNLPLKVERGIPQALSFVCMYFEKYEKYSRDNYIGCEYHDTTKITIQDGHRRQYPLQDGYRRQCPLPQLPLLVRPEAL